MYEEKKIKIAKPINLGKEETSSILRLDTLYYPLSFVAFNCGHKMKWIIKNAAIWAMSENTTKKLFKPTIYTWQSDQLSRNDRLEWMYREKKTCSATHMKKKHEERRYNRFQSKLLISLTIWLKFGRWWWSNNFFLRLWWWCMESTWSIDHCRNRLRITKLKPKQNKHTQIKKEEIVKSKRVYEWKEPNVAKKKLKNKTEQRPIQA